MCQAPCTSSAPRDGSAAGVEKEGFMTGLSVLVDPWPQGRTACQCGGPAPMRVTGPAKGFGPSLGTAPLATASSSRPRRFGPLSRTVGGFPVTEPTAVRS
ncbi:hypothetical protein GCM10020229_60140 [Kitasatospora albolonga]